MFYYKCQDDKTSQNIKSTLQTQAIQQTIEDERFNIHRIILNTIN
ncbi:hypothetical protein Psal071_01001 [Piscirickettsia salmonis]|uniref:Uncharacterized protein n=1 Tax=Piscirickettsia salmonis TaxID=1238 RepID=A0A9Q6LK86_PISSA|nr:hypothetical protein Psal006a_02296 [Piscirickettsia salmonis]QGO05374.1 hypothetical protein Psal009_01262 [Piscirickettsia salmonis]QGO33695.1 hypothetical protein Psal028_01009 [Piscirickettsia salmonis]QGO37307.1 hypothetical protein Psal040_01009 [Piscirickettsia salmonis]QGO40931.1 hypothetical protein Psal041_01008 [Piscirickettsia salmonis]